MATAAGWRVALTEFSPCIGAREARVTCRARRSREASDRAMGRAVIAHHTVPAVAISGLLADLSHAEPGDLGNELGTRGGECLACERFERRNTRVAVDAVGLLAVDRSLRIDAYDCARLFGQGGPAAVALATRSANDVERAGHHLGYRPAG